MHQHRHVEHSRYMANKRQLHDLVLGQTASVLSTLHGIAVVDIGLLDVGKTQRSTAILVASEFSCRHVSR